MNMDALKHIEKWEEYRDSRVGTYEFRAQTRYRAVADTLFGLGLLDKHVVLDVGAGTAQFGRYLRERGFRGLYSPADAVIDGVDLETYEPPPADFIVCIEVLEHLTDPMRLLGAITEAARRGVVATTPNPCTVDVIHCDPTHLSEVYPGEFMRYGYSVAYHSWFGVTADTILAWHLKRFV